jgi:hypothetical protein
MPGRSRPDRSAARAAEAGYVSVEALMAAMVLSLGVAFALGAFIKARTVGDLALEMRQARSLLAWGLTHPLAEIGETPGSSPDFQWHISLTAAGDQGLVPICQRKVDLVGAHAPFRRYGAASFEACPRKIDS